MMHAQAQWRTTSAALPKKTGVEGLCALAPPLCQERWEKWETGDGARGPAKVEHVFRGWKKPIKKYRNTSRSHIYIYIHYYIYKPCNHRTSWEHIGKSTRNGG